MGYIILALRLLYNPVPTIFRAALPDSSSSTKLLIMQLSQLFVLPQ